jgi:hypothetical protein
MRTAILAGHVAGLGSRQIDPDQTQQTVAPAALRQRLRQAVVEQQGVGQTSRRVVAGEVRHRSLPRMTWGGEAAGMARSILSSCFLMPP